MRFVLVGLLLGAGLLAVAAQPEVTVRSLLSEMADLERLTRASNPAYITRQSSSYDRNAKSPTENWFANGDYGQYLRVEHRQGRDEYVMADLKGPGAVVRIWSANPQGTLRIYVDGNQLPELIASMEDLLSGKHLDFPPPFSHRLSGGANLYYPIPYRKSLKITVDNRNDNPQSIYYHVNYRTYANGTPVQSFSMAQVKDASKLAEKIGVALTSPTPQQSFQQRRVSSVETLAPGRVVAIRTPAGAGEITELKITATPVGKVEDEGPGQSANLLRQLFLEGEFDGENCIASPLGDFFACAPGFLNLSSLPIDAKAPQFTSRWYMPQKSSGRFFITNYGKQTAQVSVEMTWLPTTWTDDTMHFHAKWRHETMRTRPMRDWNYLTADGAGRYVGAAYFISNSVVGWWGEGDEKVYIDGETFPSTFGTGTEDYYGYAWSSPALFSHPYHNQIRCDGPGTRGYTAIDRFHIFDDITWTKTFKFDMEIWHWNDVTADFAVTVYWYQKPGGKDTFVRPTASDLSFFKLPEPFKVKGANEGEDFKVLSKTGGETEIQELGEEWSGFKQIWWRDAKPGDRIAFEIPHDASANMKLTGRFCTAADYGIVQLYWNGQKLGESLDFYTAKIGLKTVEFGSVQVLAINKLEAEIIGANPAALPRNMLGIDYFLLSP